MDKEKEIPAFDRLKPRQQLFILEYLKDFNGAAAARRAGYSKKTARQIADENLTKPDIKEALKEKIDEILKNTEEIILKIQRELETTSLSDIKYYIKRDKKGIYEWKDLTKLDTRAISSIEITNNILSKSTAKGNKDKIVEQKVKLKLWDKNRAAEVLSKYLGIATNLQLVDSEGNGLFEKYLENLRGQ